MGALQAARLPIRFPLQLLFCSSRRDIFVLSLFFPHHFLLRDGLARGGAAPNAVPTIPTIDVLLRPTGYIFSVLASLYVALLKQLLPQFVFFAFLTKQTFCPRRIFTLTQSDDKPPWRNQVGGKGEHEKALVKMHMK